jgi:hypothetical protein
MAEYRDFTEEELKWIKSFQRVMKKAPKSLFLFAGDGLLVVYTRSEESKRYMTEYGGVDGYAPNKHIPTQMDVDGGDW